MTHGTCRFPNLSSQLLLSMSYRMLTQGLVNVVGEVSNHIFDEERRHKPEARKAERSQIHNLESLSIRVLDGHSNRTEYAVVDAWDCLNRHCSAVCDGSE